MIFSAKLLLSVVVVAGVSSAASIPLLMKVGGGRSSSKPVVMSVCENNDENTLYKVGYGNQTVNNVCGSQINKNEAELSATSSEYTDLFQKNGDSKNKNIDGIESSNHGWTAQCIFDGLSSKGVITVEESDKKGIKYLGLCGLDKGENTKFVKKKEELTNPGEKNPITGWICDNDCGTNLSDSVVGDTKIYQQEKEANGKEVAFYDKAKKS